MIFTCREITELIVDYIDGDMHEFQRIRFQQHICGCFECMAYLSTYQTTIHLTRQLPDEPLPAEFEVRLMAMLTEFTIEIDEDDPASGNEIEND